MTFKREMFRVEEKFTLHIFVSLYERNLLSTGDIFLIRDTPCVLTSFIRCRSSSVSNKSSHAQRSFVIHAAFYYIGLKHSWRRGKRCSFVRRPGRARNINPEIRVSTLGVSQLRDTECHFHDNASCAIIVALAVLRRIPKANGTFEARDTEGGKIEGKLDRLPRDIRSARLTFTRLYRA